MVNIFVAVIALEHVAFLVLEMFLWTKPAGLKVFRKPLAFAEQTKELAANQGLYNGFLAAGLFWSLVHSDPKTSAEIQIFFLGCVIVAGLYGAYSVNKRIFFVQAFPSIITLLLLLLR